MFIQLVRYQLQRTFLPLILQIFSSINDSLFHYYIDSTSRFEYIDIAAP